MVNVQPVQEKEDPMKKWMSLFQAGSSIYGAGAKAETPATSQEGSAAQPVSNSNDVNQSAAMQRRYSNANKY